ncbi:hypothetical protein ACFSCX_02845 [Bacillus salitolerans]|uniref:Uncharacterized protein n=1 Tax=Bacillus salitolerans TaxID=1437434 RepID=A0ABW4LLW0_9BACI
METNLRIVQLQEHNNSFTVTYFNQDEPLLESLFQCTFQRQSSLEYTIQELLQYCIQTEEFLDIKGLYSTSLEQITAKSLYSSFSHFI